MTLREPKCPTCGEILRDYGIDFEGAKIICTSCNNSFDPAIIIDNSNINYFAHIIPDEYKEQFLNKIGYEKKTTIRTWKPALIFLIIMISITVIAGVIIQYKNILQTILYLLGGCGFIAVILSQYKDEAKPKWKRKKT